MPTQNVTDIYQIKSLIPERLADSHKGDFGKILIFAGSKRYPGAAYLCTQAAVRCGSGLVTLTTDSEITDLLCIKLHEAMVLNNDSKEVHELARKSDAIAIGCGMGNNKDTLKAVGYVLNLQNNSPIVLDADGINVLAGRLDWIRGRKDILLTPHEGEFSKLIGVEVEELHENRETFTRQFVHEYGVNLLLKGKNTIIASSDQMKVNPTGSAKMASGGMGDVLTGMIASFAGQGMDIYTAGYFSAFVHGYCADEIGKQRYSVTAMDVLHEIPYTIHRMLSC